MDKNKIITYIEELKKLQEEISLDDNELNEDEFLSSLDSIVTSLSNDINNSYTPNTISLPIKIKKLTESAVIPKYSTNGDAGLDLTITSKVLFEHLNQITYGFGLLMEIPIGYIGIIFSNYYPIIYIDSNYLTEIKVTINKMDNFELNVGDIFGKIVFMPKTQIEFFEN